MKPSVYINISIGTCCLIFHLALYLVYSLKKKIPNIDNRLYNKMLFFNTITLICFVSLMANVYYGHKDIATIFNKLALFSSLAWALLFAFYIFIVILEKKKDMLKIVKSNEKKIMFFLYFVMFIYLICCLILPLDIDGTPISTPGFIFWDINVLILLIGASILIITNRKNIDRKKLLPFYLCFLTFLCVPLVLVIFPEVTFGFLVFTIISYIMYNTIENPDLKMLNELALARDQAEKANRAKSDFLASMSHEIRTPLNAIVGLSQIAHESDNLESIHEDTGDILLASQNLLDIVNGIMDINEIDADNVDLLEDKYNIKSVLDELSRMARFRIGNKDIKLRCSFDDKIPEYLIGDRDKIKRVMSNLLTNAVKYTDNGFIDFIVEANVNTDICDLRIQVKDTGKGISSDNIDKIFNKFYREEDDKDSDISGTGLGLSITKSLIELMNGKIEVDSTLNLGTTFTINVSQRIADATEN